MTTKQASTYVPGPRRQKVLDLYRKGVTQAEIARAMKISPQAVGEHIKELRERGVLR